MSVKHKIVHRSIDRMRMMFSWSRILSKVTRFGGRDEALLVGLCSEEQTGFRE